MSLENLSDDTLLEGMKKSYENAVDLLYEAHLLGEAQNFSRSYTLCQFSIEEFAKAPILFSILMERLEGSTIDYEKYDKDFYNHERKMEHGIDWEIGMFEYYKAETGKDFADKIIEKSKDYQNNIKELNDMKNESLYVDIKNNSFQSPSEVIDEEKYNKIAGIASLRKLMLQIFGKIDDKTLDEIRSGFKENSTDGSDSK